MLATDPIRMLGIYENILNNPSPSKLEVAIRDTVKDADKISAAIDLLAGFGIRVEARHRGSAIHNRRMFLRMTQAELVRLLNKQNRGATVNQSYISRVESGEFDPSFDRLDEISEALGTTVARIEWEARLIAAIEKSLSPPVSSPSSN